MLARVFDPNFDKAASLGTRPFAHGKLPMPMPKVCRPLRLTNHYRIRHIVDTIRPRK